MLPGTLVGIKSAGELSTLQEGTMKGRENVYYSIDNYPRHHLSKGGALLKVWLESKRKTLLCRAGLEQALCVVW